MALHLRLRTSVIPKKAPTTASRPAQATASCRSLPPRPHYSKAFATSRPASLVTQAAPTTTLKTELPSISLESIVVDFPQVDDHPETLSQDDQAFLFAGSADGQEEHHTHSSIAQPYCYSAFASGNATVNFCLPGTKPAAPSPVEPAPLHNSSATPCGFSCFENPSYSPFGASCPAEQEVLHPNPTFEGAPQGSSAGPLDSASCLPSPISSLLSGFAPADDTFLEPVAVPGCGGAIILVSRYSAMLFGEDIDDVCMEHLDWSDVLAGARLAVDLLLTGTACAAPESHTTAVWAASAATAAEVAADDSALPPALSPKSPMASALAIQLPSMELIAPGLSQELLSPAENGVVIPFERPADLPSPSDDKVPCTAAATGTAVVSHVDDTLAILRTRFYRCLGRAPPSSRGEDGDDCGSCGSSAASSPGTSAASSAACSPLHRSPCGSAASSRNGREGGAAGAEVGAPVGRVLPCMLA